MTSIEVQSWSKVEIFYDVARYSKVACRTGKQLGLMECMHLGEMMTGTLTAETDVHRVPPAET